MRQKVKIKLTNLINQQKERKMVFLVLSVVALLLAIVVVFNVVKIVPQGEQWLVENLGKYNRTLMPGMSFIIPFVEKVRHRVSMREMVFDIPRQMVISKDNATVSINAICYLRVTNPVMSCYNVEDVADALINLALSNIRNILGEMDLDKILSERQEINAKLLSVIDGATNDWGIKVTRVDIKDLEPPQNIKEAMEKQIKAEREKRAVILEAESIRQAQILKAEGEKQAKILKAEGERQEAFLQAEARERSAKAEAEATRLVSESISNGNKDAINYFIAQRYTEALKEIGSSGNSKIVMMPLESSNMIGSIAGVAELLKGNSHQ